MPVKHALSVPLLLALPIIGCGWQAAASDLFGWLRHPHHSCGDCDASHSTIRLPAQQIRIETTQPRVVVQNLGAGHFRHHRLGVPVVPMVQAQPIVATILAPPVASGPSSAARALQAHHEMEVKALEASMLRAAHQQEIEAVNKISQRILANLSASTPSQPSASVDDLKKTIDALSQRISDLERLLIIHDNILKKQFQEKNSN